MLNANTVEQHKNKHGLRQRLTNALRALALQQRRSTIAQVFFDLACKVDLTGPIDQSKLPATPSGFVVKQSTVLKCRNQNVGVLCLYQVVSMMVLYYWLYAATGDAQDARSCERYLDWVEAYAKAPETYTVIQGKHLELYLYPLKGTPEDQPHLPEWLTEGERETV